MEKALTVMEEIQKQKEHEISRDGLIPLDPEGRRLSEYKRFTFDIVDTPLDPLR